MNNYSKQRETILEVIKTNLIHPTAEKIYELVTKKDPKISKSTVYRNINILQEQGQIKKIKMTIGPDRYDYLIKEHSHIICERCGEVFDFYYNFSQDDIANNIQKQLGKKVSISNINIYGICEKCKSKNKEE